MPLFTEVVRGISLRNSLTTIIEEIEVIEQELVTTSQVVELEKHKYEHNLI
jgi:hypothetical protein